MSDEPKRRSLTRAQDFALMTWISCQRDRLESERPTIPEAAAQATAAVGFAVTKANLSGCLAALDFHWKPKAATRPYTAADRIARLTGNVQNLEAAVEDLRNALAREQAERSRLAARVIALETEVGPFSAAPAPKLTTKTA